MELKLGMALNYSLVRVFKPCDGDLLDGGDLSGDPFFGRIPCGLGDSGWGKECWYTLSISSLV